MRALRDKWTLTSCLHDRSDGGHPEKRILDCSIGAQHFHDGLTWQIQVVKWLPSPLRGFDLYCPTLFFETHVNLTTGTKRVYPRKNLPPDGVGAFAARDSEAYIELTPKFLGRPSQYQTDKMVRWDYDDWKFAYKLSGSGIKIWAPLTSKVRFDRFEFEVKEVGCKLEDYIGRPKYWEPTALAEAMVNPELDLESLHIHESSWTFKDGLLTLPFDLAGLSADKVMIFDPPLNLQIAAWADDDYARRVPTGWTNTSSAIEAGNYQSGSKGYGSALRFTGVNISSEDRVNVAHLTIIGRNAMSGTVVRTDVCCENSNNPGQIADYVDHIGRTRTPAVAWDGIPAWEVGGSYESSSYVTPLQTVVDDQSGTGDAIIVFWEDKDIESDDGARRLGCAYEHATYDPAATHIEFVAGAVRVPRHGFVNYQVPGIV